MRNSTVWPIRSGLASARDIRVTNTPDVLSDDVADLAVGMVRSSALVLGYETLRGDLAISAQPLGFEVVDVLGGGTGPSTAFCCATPTGSAAASTPLR